MDARKDPTGYLVVPAIGAVYLMIARALLARYVIARFWLVYRQVRFRDQSRVLDADNSFFRIEYHHNEELKGIPNSITNHQRAAALSFWGLTLGVSVYFIWLFMDWAPAYWFCNYRVFVPFMTVVLGLAAATMITIVSARAFYDLERVFEREYESERAGEPTDNESDKG